MVVVVVKVVDVLVLLLVGRRDIYPGWIVVIVPC